MIDTLYVVLFCSIVSVIILILCCAILLSKIKMDENAQRIIIIVHPNYDIGLGRAETAVRVINHRNCTV